MNSTTTTTTRPADLPKVTAPTAAEATVALIAQADAFHAAYPQYAHKFDTWVAVPAKKQVKLRGTVIFTPGDWALMDPASPEVADDPWTKPSARGKTFASFWVPNAYGPGTGSVAVLPILSFDSRVG